MVPCLRLLKSLLLQTLANSVASKSTSNSGKSAEFNVIRANPTDKSYKGKKKGKFKAKSNTLKQDSQKPRAGDGSQHKLKYTCLICDDEHFTKDCPR